jgi:hypothetical protein
VFRLQGAGCRVQEGLGLQCRQSTKNICAVCSNYTTGSGFMFRFRFKGYVLDVAFKVNRRV